MTEYISEIQRRLITEYGFPKGENGCPKNVPDGAYPMKIEGDLDLVIVAGGTISCCNFITKKGGLLKFRNRIKELAVKALWQCPVCGHRMTEEESKGYNGCPTGCPTGMHLAQHEKAT